MIISWPWTSDKKMRPCPFCGGKNTFCTIETTNIETVAKKPVFDAVIKCHICGCTMHHLDPDKDVAVNRAKWSWEHRAGDEE